MTMGVFGNNLAPKARDIELALVSDLMSDPVRSRCMPHFPLRPVLSLVFLFMSINLDDANSQVDYHLFRHESQGLSCRGILSL